VIAAGILLVLSQAATPEPREIALEVKNRFGFTFENAAICRVEGDACVPVAVRLEERRVVVTVPGDAKTLLRVSAGGYETRDVEVPEGPGDGGPVPVALVAKSSLTITLLPFDTRREAALELRLVDEMAREKPKVFESRRVTLAAGQRSEKALLENVPPGRYRLQWEGPTVALGEKVVEVAPEKRTDTGTIGLKAGKLVEGRIVDDLGSPVEGARIRLSSGAVGDGFARMATTGAGAFVLGYPTGEPMRWVAPKIALRNGRMERGNASRSCLTAQTVKGRLVDEKGDPVAFASAALHRGGRPAHSERQTCPRAARRTFSFFREFVHRIVLTVDTRGFERKGQTVVPAGSKRSTSVSFKRPQGHHSGGSPAQRPGAVRSPR
jgi:hypothetical protein